MALVDASGAAVVLAKECLTVGATPPEDMIRALIDWLSTTRHADEVFATDCLAAQWPQARDWAASASGLLAISISQIHRSYVLWFRPELVQTVKWSGDPRKPQLPEGNPLHPRKSFEIWKETVRLKSTPWSSAQLAAVNSLRNAVIGIVMRKAEELADLTAELTRSNKELEAFSYSVSHDLRAPFRHIVGYAELLKEEQAVRDNTRALRYVDTIIESAHAAGKLVDGLLGFSQAGRTVLSKRPVDVDQVLRECLRILEPDLKNRRIEWQVHPLGNALADPTMLRQVFQNLLSNALKYTRAREVTQIRVARTEQDGDIVFCVQDNGVGFDMRYVDKLFGVFQRLHRMEEFEGSGIGLANVRRIAERHHGRAWAEGEIDQGATFYFALPYCGELVDD
jgi:light-regulated signal transduction histidine kinase (bacteriophytochrome)